MNPPAARVISIQHPRTLVFGAGCIAQCAQDLVAQNRFSAFIVTSPPTRALCAPLEVPGATVWDGIKQEPTVADFKNALAAARKVKPDAVIGVGGGSVLDVAKLIAAFVNNEQDISETFGIGKLSGRSVWLACLPTTAGTGSEVSPNAILLDESDQLKKGVISPHLMPDAAYVDPALTLTVPPAITGATGLDALTHCIEAYANKFAHPMIDMYALEGIRLISSNLKRAYDHGQDLEARTNLAMGSMYGGICLGPVNTGAVHALSYPLGGEFHVPHGVANAVLLSHVIEFNLPAAPKRYAEIAAALGARTPEEGVSILRGLVRGCGIPLRLSDLKIPENAIERMAKSAMTVTRLLDRNVRTVTLEDAINIYRKAF